MLRSVFSPFRPRFWGRSVGTGPYKALFDYHRIWWLSVALLAGVSLVPLLVMTLIDYNMTRQAFTSEYELRTSRVTSNARRTISAFFEERLAALEYVAHSVPDEELTDSAVLQRILENLKSSFGRFVDLGVISAEGRQIAYAGPFDLMGLDYSGQPWFETVRNSGTSISDVFLGYRQVPHMVVAVRRNLKDGSFRIVRATLDTERLNELLASLDLFGGGDAFLVNSEGVLQTPSRSHGAVMRKLALPVPAYSDHTQVVDAESDDGQTAIVGYAYISDTPFILMVVKNKARLMEPWYRYRLELGWFLAASLAIIMLVVLGVATRMVEHIYLADQTRARTLREIEHTSRMASIGRLAAGVAHEINNPLAIIGEKAGLIKDLFTFRPEFQADPRLLGLVDAIIGSVERCGTITKRLLGFARHIEVHLEELSLAEVVREVLSFLVKEAEYRSISIVVDEPEKLPRIVSDRGKTQQVFLNIVNNAFQAMQDGGRLRITLFCEEDGCIAVSVIDDGCGIPEADLKRIYEPFYTTKRGKGGTGLGLSITFGLVQELGGRIEVESEVGKGTEFVISLPRVPPKHKEKSA